MICAPVRSIIPSLKLGNYLSVQAHKPCSISHIYIVRAYLFTSQVLLLLSKCNSSTLCEEDFKVHVKYISLFCYLEDLEPLKLFLNPNSGSRGEEFEKFHCRYPRKLARLGLTSVT